MSMSAIKSLDELEVLAGPVLRLKNPIREKFINIARRNNRGAAYVLAGDTAVNHGYTFREAEIFAKATGWLVVIRKDFGDAVFEKIVAKER